MNSMVQQNEAGQVYVQSPGVTHKLAQEEIIDFGEMLRFVLERKLLVLLIIMLFTLIAGGYAFTATPVYQSDAVIQVESEASPIPGLAALEPMMGDDVSSLTEMEIIKSRKIIGSVVDELGLRVRAAPHYFPVFGAGMARLSASNELAPIPLGLDLGEYAWGGEAIQVEDFRLDDRSRTGGIWRVEKVGDSTYRLLDAKARPLLKGTVGQAVEVNDPEYGGIHLLITTLKGRPGVKFDLSMVSRMKAIGQLLSRLGVSEKGKKTGIISVTLTGPDRSKSRQVLDQITTRYLKYDVEKKSTEAAQTLGFIQQQLPQLKTEVDKTEAALNEYRQTKGAGAVALDLETQATIEAISEIETQLYVFELENSELSEKFTPLHPSRLAVSNKIEMMRGKKAQLDQQLHKMPEAQWESVKLTRDTTVANELYVMLLNKAQEFKLAKAGVVGNAYILDRAMDLEAPIKPKKSMIVMIGLFSGVAVAIFMAQFLGFRKLNRLGLSSPDEIEQKTGLPVFVSILHSDIQENLDLKHKKKNSSGNKVIARTHPEDLAVESLRSFRTALQFAQIESRNNVVMISGSAPGVGKSFVCANLASVLADSGKKVLVIDADIRKGYLHNYFGLKRSPGLSDFILGKNKSSEIINKVESNFRFIATGTVPPNPSEVLMSSAFAKLISRASEHYDVVLIDTPPILAVTDASIIAKHVGTVFMTLKWGMHTEHEIKDAVKRFKQSGVNVNGLILNDIPVGESGGYNGYYQYQYQYARR